MVTKILLVENLSIVRDGLGCLIEKSGKADIVGEAANGREAVKLARKLKPNIILMDIAMPEMNGIEATRQIRSVLPEVRVIMLSVHTSRQYVFESLRAGAAGYVCKSAAVKELLSAIDKVLAGETYISAELEGLIRHDYLRWVRGEPIATELEKLTDRERNVLQLIAEGHSSSEIAPRLHVSVRTVDSHRFHIMEKLDIRSIAELTKFAIRNGLTSL
jgi:DNA-binding NarL/FixJ family response regulator